MLQQWLAVCMPDDNTFTDTALLMNRVSGRLYVALNFHPNNPFSCLGKPLKAFEQQCYVLVQVVHSDTSALTCFLCCVEGS